MYVTVITVIKIVPFNSMFTRTVKGPQNLLRYENFFYYKYTSRPPFSPWSTSHPPDPL